MKNGTDLPHIAIVGGGAAGFFAAIEAKRRLPQAEVCIFEKGSKVLAKVEITGGGRCNLTNSFEGVSDLKQVYPRGHKLMKRLFNVFDHNDTMEWFEGCGVRLVTQADCCVFPQSQDSHSITGCLLAKARALGVVIRTGQRLTSIERMGDGRLMLGFDVPGGLHRMLFDRVAITTGGHPRAESFGMFADLGHGVEQPVPSLFTLNVADKAFRGLMGTVVEQAIVSVPATRFKAEGPLLVTHWGMSGPAVLKLSSHAARHMHEKGYALQVAVNWAGETDRGFVEERVRAMAAANPQKLLSSLNPCGVPSRLWQYLLGKMRLAPEKKWAELGKKGCNVMVETLTNDVYDVCGKGSFKDEFVTCGGIALGSLNLNTLESKVCPNLFFAGEVADVDAVTGGFNLQAAWTMGYVVGRSIVE